MTLEARRRLKEEREALESAGKGKENSLLARAPKIKKHVSHASPHLPSPQPHDLSSRV